MSVYMHMCTPEYLSMTLKLHKYMGVDVYMHKLYSCVYTCTHVRARESASMRLRSCANVSKHIHVCADF